MFPTKICGYKNNLIIPFSFGQMDIQTFLRNRGMPTYLLKNLIHDQKEHFCTFIHRKFAILLQNIFELKLCVALHWYSNDASLTHSSWI